MLRCDRWVLFRKMELCSDDVVLWGEPYVESDIEGLDVCQASCMDDPDCLSFGYDTDFANPCHFYNEASIKP